MKKWQAVRAVSFILLFLVIFHSMNKVLIRQMSDEDNLSRVYSMYHTERDNSWTGTIIGASTVYNGWAAPVAWHESGYAIYPSSWPSMSFVFDLNIIKEVQEKQGTDFFIVDIRNLRSLTDYYKEKYIRYVLDSMPMTQNRTDAIERGLNMLEELHGEGAVQDDKLSYYISFFKYHSRWSMLQKSDYVKVESIMKGALQEPGHAFGIKPVKKLSHRLTDECDPLNKLQEKYLTELLDYAKENNLKMLFISMPVARFDGNELKVQNEAFRIIESYGYPTINFNTEEMYEELDLDFSTDYQDRRHLNSKGARKFTTYLTKYIQENFDLEDLRGKEEYKDWDEAWETYDAFYTEGWAAKELEMEAGQEETEQEEIEQDEEE